MLRAWWSLSQKQKQLDKKQATVDQLTAKFEKLQNDTSAQLQKTSSLHTELAAKFKDHDAQPESKRWESTAQALQQQLEKVRALRLSLSRPLLTAKLCQLQQKEMASSLHRDLATKFQEKDAKWESTAQALAQKLEQVRIQGLAFLLIGSLNLIVPRQREAKISTLNAKLGAAKLGRKSLQRHVVKLEQENEKLQEELARKMKRSVGSPPRPPNPPDSKGPKQVSSSRQPASSRRSSSSTATDLPEAGTELASMWPELASAWEPAKAENPMHKELLKSAIHRELRKKTTANKGSPKRHETRFTDRLSSPPSRKKVSPRTVNRAPAVENSFDISDLVSPGNLAAFLQDTSSSEEDSDFD